jgi:hypothetical protein
LLKKSPEEVQYMRRKFYAIVAILALLCVATTESNAEFVASGNTHQGKEVMIDLPLDLHIRNVGGSDGLGLCVFASLSHAGKWQSDPVATAIFPWMRTKPGGGYPSKVDAMLARLGNELGQKCAYIQHTQGDDAFLDAALATGRFPCVTYNGRDGVYYRNGIAHMVNLAYMDATTAAIHDNNYPGKWLWMTRAEFLQRWRGGGGGGGWAVVLLNPPPPPIPVNTPLS